MTRKRKRPAITYGKHNNRKQERALSISSSDHNSDGIEMFFPNSNDVDLEQKPPPLPPNRPTSQKAASMPAEPDPEQIAMFEAVTGAPRKDAVRYLKAKNNIDEAVNAFFAGEDISKAEAATQWDESHWAAGKDGDAAMGGVGNDQLLHPLGSSAAATRPNSPAPSTRSNMQPTSKQQEDDDLQRVIAESQGLDVSNWGSGGGGNGGVTAYQGFGGQETGVIEGGGGTQGGQVFGPANREHYNQDQWALVPLAGASASMGTSEEVIFDTAVGDRVYVEGEGPRLLKPLPGGDFLPGLLAICASIEGARERMLMRECVLGNYGSDKEWWRGHSIRLPKIVHMEDGRPADAEGDDQEEIVAEVQRLMAFLSSSKRSYGSAAALTQTNAIKSRTPFSTASGTLLELFMEQWAVAATTKAADPTSITSLFHTTIGTNDSEGMNSADMGLIDMQVAIPEGDTLDLSEILDSLLWNTDPDGVTMADNYIERPADLLVMRVYQASKELGPQLRVEVPAQFHVDKYLKENIEATRATRQQMALGKKRIAKITEVEKKLMQRKHPHKPNETLSAGALLKHTLGHFTGQNRRDVAAVDKAANIAVPDEEIPEDPPHYEQIAAKLQQVMESIDAKLATLREEKERTQKAIAGMSKAPPPGMEEGELRERYTLRGVATKPGVTYVTVPKESAAMEGEEDAMVDGEAEGDGAQGQGYQWWRLEYDANVSNGNSFAKLTKTKADDYDVLRAVELEHNSALLVYASDRISVPSPSPADPTLDPELQHSDSAYPPFHLPQALEDFIKADNAHLEADIHRAEVAELPAYNNLNDEVRPSIEPQDSARNSMDSTRVDVGDGDGGSMFGDPPSPPGYESEGFMGHPGFGMGPADIKQGSYAMDEDAEAPVHEITLDDFEEGGVEMVEKAHEPLADVSGAGGRGDVRMEGAGSQQGGRGDGRMEGAGSQQGGRGDGRMDW